MSTPPTMLAPTKTFGEQIFSNRYRREIENDNRFERSLSNRFNIRKNKRSMASTEENTTTTSSSSKNSDKISLVKKIKNIKFKKIKMSKNGPQVRKIFHDRPPRFKTSLEATIKPEEYRDPRFDEKIPASSASSLSLSSSSLPQIASNNKDGWKLRNAYGFLDDIIQRDIGMIDKTIRSTKSKEVKKSLREELIKLKNHQNSIKLKDLEQKSKSELRKEELHKLKNGIKINPYYTNKSELNQKIKNNKFEQLKNEGRLDKYLKNKTKKVNNKFRNAITGQGWLDQA